MAYGGDKKKVAAELAAALGASKKDSPASSDKEEAGGSDLETAMEELGEALSAKKYKAAAKIFRAAQKLC